MEVKRAIPRSKINSVSTPGSQQGSSLLSSPATNVIGMNSLANIRAEVRRTASFGSGAGLPSSSPMTLSGNSSTLRAKLPVPVNGNGPNPLIPTRAVSATSYAAALKLGGVTEGQKMESGPNSALMSSFLSGTAGNGHQDISTVRASRALSEPLVKYEGSGLLGGDAVDFVQFTQGQASSQGMSQSSSVILPSGSCGGNLLSGTNLANMTFSPEGSVHSGVGSHATLDKRYSESIFPGDASTVSNMFFSSPLSTQFDGMDLNGNFPGALNLPPPIQQPVHFDGSMNPDYGRSRGSSVAKSPGTYSLTGFESFASIPPLPAANSQDKLFSTPSRDLFDMPHQLSNGSLKSNSNQPTPQHIPSLQSWSNMLMPNDQAGHTNGLWQQSPQQPIAQLPLSYSMDRPAAPMPSLSFDGGALFPGEERNPALFTNSFSRTPSKDDGQNNRVHLGLAPQQHSSASWLAGGDFSSLVSSQQQEQQQQYDWTGSFGSSAGQQQQLRW